MKPKTKVKKKKILVSIDIRLLDWIDSLRDQTHETQSAFFNRIAIHELGLFFNGKLPDFGQK
jgi:hypothetical protein